MRAQTMYDRLSSITQRIPGLKLTQMPTSQGGGYFISTDMFYIEVLMDPSRVKVIEVKVAHNSEPSPCPVLTQVLFNNDLETFARHLEGLASIYQLNTDKKQKSRAYTALTALETDLSRLASIQSTTINNCYNIIHKSPLGLMEPRKGGLPVRLTYFISPYDLVDVSKKEMISLTTNNIMDKNLGLSVTIGIEASNTIHVLQTTTLISIRETLEGKSLPSSAPHVAHNSASLPAYFVMKLSKPMPVSLEFIKKIDQIIKIPEFSANILQEPLINLIAKHQLEIPSSTPDDGLDFRKSVYCAKFFNQQHIYHVSGTQVDKFIGAFVTKIPFTHPTNIPNILKFLRQQAVFNFIIGSCIRECRPSDSPLLADEEQQNEVNIFDINPINLSSICVTFEHPSKESLATLEIDLENINEIRCQLHALNMDSVCSDEYASKILQKCWSIPITMRSVIRKCLEKTTHLREEAERNREREVEELLISNSQQAYQNSMTPSGRDASNPYLFESVNGEILSNNLLFPHQGNSTNQQSSTLSSGASSASFLLAGLTDPSHRSSLNYNLGPDVSNMNHAHYLKRFIRQPRTKADLQPSTSNLRISSLPPNKTNSQLQTNIKVEGSVPIKKPSISKQSNTMLMSMLSDIPAANTQSQMITSNRPGGQNLSINQRTSNIQRPLQTQSIINKQNPTPGQFQSAVNINQKQPNDNDPGMTEKQKKSRKRKGGIDAEGASLSFGPKSPKNRKTSDEPLNSVIAIENNVSSGGGSKLGLPNIILPGSRMDIKIKNDQSGQSHSTISYISNQPSNTSKFGMIQDATASITNSNIRRDSLETDSTKKEKKRKRAEITDNTKSASNTTSSSSIVGQPTVGNSTKVAQLGGQASNNQIKSGNQPNSINMTKPRKSSIGAVIDRLVGAVNQTPSTTTESQSAGPSPSSSSSSSGDSSKSNPDLTSSSASGPNRADSSTKVGPSSTSSAKAPKYSRGSDQFAIKQGSSGLKLTVTKTKPATPPSSSVPEAVSKILNLGTTSNIKYTIPKLSKTQQAAQSSSSTLNQATSSDQSQTQSNSNEATTATTTTTTVTNILASTSTSVPSSTTAAGAIRKNPAMSFRGNGPGSLVRNSVSSSTHPTNKSLLSSLTTVGALNRPSSTMQPDSMSLQRISSSNNVGHPPQVLTHSANRPSPRFNVPAPLGQNRFVSTIVTPNVAPQFTPNPPSVMANQSEMTNYPSNQSTINIRPIHNKFMSSSIADANNISSSRSHTNNQQSNSQGTSSMVSYGLRPGVDSPQTAIAPKPSSSSVAGAPQFYVRQSTFDEGLSTSQTMSLPDNNTPTMVASTISHPTCRDDSDSCAAISTFSLLPRPIGRISEPFSSNKVEQSCQEDVPGRSKAKQPSSDDNKMIESPIRASGVTSSSDVPKSTTISSTPSSPADCNQQVEVLPPPPLIPIDSLDDDQPPRDSIASSDNDASDRLSIVDINEAMADSISSAGTPKPYAVGEMTSPSAIEHTQHQQHPPSAAFNDPSSVVTASEQYYALNNPDERVLDEDPSESTESINTNKLKAETTDFDSCFNEVQLAKSPAPSQSQAQGQCDNSCVSDQQVTDPVHGTESADMSTPNTTQQDQLTPSGIGPHVDVAPQSFSIKTTSSGSTEPSSASEIQSQNKTLSTLRGISSYNADSEGTSSSTEGTPTNKSPDQELDNDYGKMPNIINANAPTAMDSFVATTCTVEPSGSYDCSSGANQFDKIIDADKFLSTVDEEARLDFNDHVSSEAQATSREPDVLSNQTMTSISDTTANEPITISTIISTQSNNESNGEAASQTCNENPNQASLLNSESNRLSTNESDANVISAQSPSSV